MAAASGCGSGPGRCSTSAAGRTAPWRRPRPSGRLAGWKAAGAGGPSPSGTEIVSNKCPLLPVLPPTNEPGLVSLSSACWLSPLTLDVHTSLLLTAQFLVRTKTGLPVPSGAAAAAAESFPVAACKKLPRVTAFALTLVRLQGRETLGSCFLAHNPI